MLQSEYAWKVMHGKRSSVLTTLVCDSFWVCKHREQAGACIDQSGLL